MKQLLIKTLLTSLSLFAFTGCDEFLDVDNPNFPSTDEAFRDLNGTNSALNAVYNSLYNHFVLAIVEESISSDVAIPGNKSISEANVNENALQFHQQLFNESSQIVSRKWSALYRGIFFANQTIAALKNIRDTITSDADIDRWTNQMAQARFFRGLYHFYLHERFNNGDVIIISDEDLTNDINEINSRPISPSDEVIDFFREDLLFAYENLPLPSEIEDAGRVSKGTAATILANSYLFEEEFDLAKPLYEEVINDFGYELVRDLDLLFTTAGEFNAESIFEISYTTDFGTEANIFNEESLSNRLAIISSFFATGGDAVIAPASWLVDEYSKEKINPLDPRNRITNGEGFDDFRGVSLRASAMVALVQDYETPYYGNINVLQTPRPNGESVIGGNNFNFTPSQFKHFSNHDIVQDERNLPSGSNRSSGKNVTINRLGEVYINLAEVYLRGDGNLNRALELINTLRDRWGVQKLGTDSAGMGEFDNKSYTVASLLKHIQDVEKPLELSVEGHAIRNIDLRRWGIKQERFQLLSSQIIQVTRSKEISSELARGPVKRAFNSRVIIDGMIEGQDPVVVLNLPEPIPSGGGPSPGGQASTPQFREFTAASQNYTDANNAYWPIPISETQENNTL